VSFKYEASGPDYALVTGEGTQTNTKFTLQPANEPATASFSFVAGDTGDSWFGIEKLNDNETDFVIDDIIIIER
jgi:endo-alpha-N-acetylgalactosaminidase